MVDTHLALFEGIAELGAEPPAKLSSTEATLLLPSESNEPPSESSTVQDLQLEVQRLKATLEKREERKKDVTTAEELRVRDAMIAALRENEMKKQL